jgi:hypothetical protein
MLCTHVVLWRLRLDNLHPHACLPRQQALVAVAQPNRGQAQQRSPRHGPSRHGHSIITAAAPRCLIVISVIVSVVIHGAVTCRRAAHAGVRVVVPAPASPARLALLLLLLPLVGTSLGCSRCCQQSRLVLLQKFLRCWHRCSRCCCRQGIIQSCSSCGSSITAATARVGTIAAGAACAWQMLWRHIRARVWLLSRPVAAAAACLPAAPGCPCID